VAGHDSDISAYAVLISIFFFELQNLCAQLLVQH